MGDKDVNDAICQTDITGKIIAHTNIEGIAAAAIELKIFSSTLTGGGSKPKDDDKKKKKKPLNRKQTIRKASINPDSADENSLEEDGEEMQTK